MDQSKKTVEVWQQECLTPNWLFRAAKRLHKWAIGRALTKEAYLDAIARTQANPIGGRK